MNYLQKTIEDVYGHSNNCLVLGNVVVKASSVDAYEANGHINLYKDLSAYLAKKDNSDSFEFRYPLTVNEVDGATRYILLQKITESVIIDGNETNILIGRIGPTGFQDAVIMST